MRQKSVLVFVLFFAASCTLAIGQEKSTVQQSVPGERSERVSPDEQAAPDDNDPRELRDTIRRLQSLVRGARNPETDLDIRDLQKTIDELQMKLREAEMGRLERHRAARRAAEARQEEQLEELSTKLQAMKEERLEILSKFYDEARAQYDEASVGIDQLLESEKALWDAELDLKPQRSAYGVRLKRLRSLEESLDESRKMDANVEQDYLKVKAERLKTNISWLQGVVETMRPNAERSPGR